MVCKPTVNSTKTKVLKVTKKIANGAIEKKKKIVTKPIDMEFCALRNLVPGSGEKSDLDVVLDAINYIQSLEEEELLIYDWILYYRTFIEYSNVR